MRYVATQFSIVLGAWRLRIGIDLEDDPEIKTLAMQRVMKHRERERESTLR